MSENENQPAPSKQTSSVPLKKETVRVTLRAVDAPPAAGPPAPTVGPPVVAIPGSAPVVRPPTPTVGGAPRPPTPAPTIPLKSVGPPTGMGTGAPTIRLATAPGSTTGAMRPAGLPSAPTPGPTIALPKATVQLQAPTQALGTGRPSLTQSPTLQSEEDDDEGSGETVASVLSIVGFIAALAVLTFQIMITNTSLGAKYMAVAGETKGTPPNYSPPAESPADRSLINELFSSEQ